jgi:hypothetical protein
MMLNAEIQTPIEVMVVSEGWLFQAIHSVEITVSNSLISNMVVPGTSLREYMLACCCDEVERRNLLKTAGRITGSVAAGQSHKASIPIGWLLGCGTGLKKDFPIDMSILNGPILVQINWNPSNTFAFYSSTGAAVPGTATPLIAAFSSLNLTASTTDLLDGAFGVRNALMANPGSTYVLPATYLNAIKYPFTGQGGVSTTINLNSAPSGMLEALVLTIKPTSEILVSGLTATTSIPGSVGLSSLRLQYGGQDLF